MLNPMGLVSHLPYCRIMHMYAKQTIQPCRLPLWLAAEQ